METSTSLTNASQTNQLIHKKNLAEEDIEKLIEKFCILHSKMQFDAAKELVEEERTRLAGSAICTSVSRLWQTILLVLLQFIMCETAYYSYMFFITKFSFRKENHIRDIYLQLKSELQKCALDGTQILQSKPKNEKNLIEKFLILISTEFAQFSLVRVELIDFYIALPNYDWRNVSEMCENKLLAILNNCPQSKNLEFVEILKNFNGSDSYIKEIMILCQLFKTHETIVDCNMADSLIQLKELRQSLSDRFNYLENKAQPKQSTSFFLAFSKKNKPAEKMALLHFLNKFYQTLFAKFSLYFHDFLAPFAMQNDAKAAFCSNYSFLHNFQNFYRKSSPQIISIFVSRIDLTTPFYGFGYHHFLSKFSNNFCKPSTGINEKYPPLYICPQEKKIIDSFYINIVNFVQDLNIRRSNFASSSSVNDNDNKIKYLFDKSKEQTFFTANIEKNIYLAVAYDRRVQERESVVVNFFNDALTNLRLIKLFQDLRNFIKT